MIGNTVPTVVPSGGVQPATGSDERLARLAGGRHPPRQQLHARRRADHRHAQPRQRAPVDRIARGHEGAGAHLRRGNGPHGRRVFNTTLKSGTNDYRGSGFFQTRPIWGQWNNYFGEKAGRPKPDSPYYLGGGAVGGPIVRNRTFFWFATESYRRADAQRQHAVSDGRHAPRRLLRRDQFGRPAGDDLQPGHRLAVCRQSDSGDDDEPGRRGHARYLPLPDVDRDNGSTNYTRTSRIKSNFSQLYSIKLEHKFTNNVSLSGFYLYSSTNEPEANFFGTADQTEPNRFADPNDYYLRRRPQILALNNTWVLSSTAVLALRFGRRIPGQRHPHHRFRSAEPALFLDVSPDSIEQVSAGSDPRLRPGHGRARSGRSTRPKSTGSPPARTPRCRKSPARTRSSSAATGGRWASTPSSPATGRASSISTRT